MLGTAATGGEKRAEIDFRYPSARGGVRFVQDENASGIGISRKGPPIAAAAAVKLSPFDGHGPTSCVPMKTGGQLDSLAFGVHGLLQYRVQHAPGLVSGRLSSPHRDPAALSAAPSPPLRPWTTRQNRSHRH